MPLNMESKKHGASRGWTVICDFDGTVTPFDATDALLERFADKRWEAVEQEWQRGSITARQCMEEQVTLLHAARNDLDAFLDTIPLREGFAEFIDFCERKALPVLVVSDGLDYSIRRILLRHGLERLPVIANRLVFNGPNAYRLKFPYGASGCPSGVCKCAVAQAAEGRFALVGDGRSDCCLAGAATVTLALRGKELERTCRREGYPCLPYTDFFEVRALVESLLQAPLPSGQRAGNVTKAV